MKELKESEIRKIYGGRDVEKVDLDGDGKWDIKAVQKKNRVKVKYR